jgi:hypothetical protein
MAMQVGNCITRSRLIDFFLNSSKKVTINVVMLLFVTIYVIIINWGVTIEKIEGKLDYIRPDSVVYLVIISFFLGMPSGLVYSYALYRALGGKSNNELLYLF